MYEGCTPPTYVSQYDEVEVWWRSYACWVWKLTKNWRSSKKSAKAVVRVACSPWRSCLARDCRVRHVNPSGSQPVFLQGWVEERGRHTRQSCLQLPPTTALTDLDAHITDVFPDVKLATPGIECLDKTHFPTHKGDPLVR